MIDEIIAIYAIVEDLLKAVGNTEDNRVQMSDAEVITAALLSLIRRSLSPLSSVVGKKAEK